MFIFVVVEVLHEGIYLFVRWENTCSREGRPIMLDDKLRVKYNIPFLVPKKNYVGSRILVTNTGAVMWKAIALCALGPMPPWCVVFQEWHEAHLLTGPTTKGSCILCAALATRGHVGEPEGLLFRCTACAKVWHECCAKRCSTNVGAIDWALFVCPACSNHLRA